MELFFRKIGEGKPLVVLHGVFGSSDNLYTVSKNIADLGYAVYTLDARNHGQSPWSDVFDYDVMAADLNDFLNQHDIQNPVILGHSMGGKTVMNFAAKYDNFEKIIVVDIAPRFYPTHHNHILAGLAAIKLDELKSRKDADDIFSQYVSDFGERQFILKNLYRTDDNKFAWRINIPVISKEIYKIGEEITFDRISQKPAMIMRGSDSGYVKEDDFEQFKQSFPNAELVTIDGANHWVHALKPSEFVSNVVRFIKV